MELASGKKDRELEAEDIFLLPDGRKELEPFADRLRNDRQVQRRVADAWNSIVQQGQDRVLPTEFTFPLVNPPNKSWADEWLKVSGHDYDVESEHLSSDWDNDYDYEY